MKKFRRIAAAFLALVFACLAILPAFAEEVNSNGELTFDELGKKEATYLGRPGEYEVTITVPGEYSTDKYNELIVMVDASLSQGGNFTQLKQLLMNLAESTLTGDPTMKLTLMGFGVGPKLAGSFYTVEQLEAFLATATQDDFLQERSATNCEVGFTFVNDYINSSENLEKAFVLYTSDGHANFDESGLDWSQWYDTTKFKLLLDEIATVEYVSPVEIKHIALGNAPISATATLFPDECAAVAIAEMVYGNGSDEHNDALNALEAAINANGREWITAILKDIFNFSALNWDEEQSVSTVEKAFAKYFRAYPGRDDSAYSYYMDLVYIIMGNTGKNFQLDRYVRAAAASSVLQANEKVQRVYHIGYNDNGSVGSWMKLDSIYYEDTSKLEYIYADNFADIVDELEELGEEFVTTVYKDVTVDDPMSEYVDLDPSSIRICFDGEVVYRYGQGWTGDLQPTAEDPITLTQMENGKYHIQWKIKDGPLLHTDRYSLHYRVNVDTSHPEFVQGVDFPANGVTTATYLTADDVTVMSEIAVPEVSMDNDYSGIPDGSMGVRLTKQALDTGEPISDIVFDIYLLPTGSNFSSVPTESEIASYAVSANKYATIVTDINGYAEITLPEGIYLFVEQESDKVKAPVEPFYVRLPGIDPQTGGELYIVDVYPKNEPVETEPPEVEIPDETDPEYTGSFSILKHRAGNEERVLEGAKFQVLRLAEDGETGYEYTYGGQTVSLVPAVDSTGIPVIITTNDEGHAVALNLEVGLYFLLETEAPFGYVLPTDVIPVYASVNGYVLESTKIENVPYGPLLPDTGGMGTVLYVAVGAVICLAAGIILIAKLRAKKFEVA